MGVKFLFSWFSNNFPEVVTKVPKEDIDVLLLDLNGIFHSSAQKVFQYGNHKTTVKTFLRKVRDKTYDDVYQSVVQEIELIVKTIKPKKSLVLCVDGVAPLSKQNQQRQRRYKTTCISSTDKNPAFNSNAITPGTDFMDGLSIHIQKWIETKIKQDNYYSRLSIVFSNEKVPGEGEAKCLEFVRKQIEHSEQIEHVYCMVGMDADLIMLGLLAPCKKFYIYRENNIPGQPVFWIDVGGFRDILQRYLFWFNQDHDLMEKNLILDFVLVCFVVGNDFLPNLPTAEILEGGIEKLFSVYRDVGARFGHMTHYENGRWMIKTKACKAFFEQIGREEKKDLEKKAGNMKGRFPYTILENNCIHDNTNGTVILQMDSFVKDYYKKYFNNTDLKKACEEYVRGLQWVLEYYTKGVPSWTWYYPHAFAPFATDIMHHFDSESFTKQWPSTYPSDPFLQLLFVLPPVSADLLPSPLRHIMGDLESYPIEFDIDYSGKRNEWEGIPILPKLYVDEIRNKYEASRGSISQKDMERNRREIPWTYSKRKV